MKNQYIPFLISLIILNSSFVISQELPKELKVITYNIWNGFERGKDIKRKNNWIEWIKKENPDVLALQELCGYNEETLKEDAIKWGHKYVKISKTGGYPVGLTSKEPITVKERVIKELWHGMLHCKTYGIDFFVVHLSPFDCDFRLKEANIIAQKVVACNNNKFIILGDFNSHSPFDGELLKYNYSLLLNYSNQKLDNDYCNLRMGMFDYSVISKFISMPTIDECQRFVNSSDRYSFPTPALIGTWQTADEVKNNKERIDYILTSPAISRACTNAIIFHNIETGNLSDHYPVMAEFKFWKNKNYY